MVRYKKFAVQANKYVLLKQNHKKTLVLLRTFILSRTVNKKNSDNAYSELHINKYRWKQIGRLTVKDRLESAEWCKALQQTW